MLVTHGCRRSRTGAVVANLAFLALAACSAAPRTIRIGLAGPFSDSTGAPMLRAARLAAETINRSGGINGLPLELVALDDHGDPDSAVRVAMAFREAGVIAVIGPVYSEATLAAAPVYNDPAHPLLQITPSATAPAISDAGPYTFRTCPSDRQQGAALAGFVRERLGLRRGSILYANNEYGRGLRTAFADEFSRIGGQVDEIAPYLDDRPAVGAYLERLARRRTSQFVFLAGSVDEAPAILREARRLRISVPFIGGDGLEGLEAAGPVADGTYLSAAYLASDTSAQNQAFVEAYRRKYPGASPPNQPAAATWDLLLMLRQAVADVGTGTVHLRNWVGEVGQRRPAFQGVTGEIGFDDNGDVPRLRVLIAQIERGQVRQVSP
jgi:branched-chain amino acid transport system substrate-binding protein